MEDENLQDQLANERRRRQQANTQLFAAREKVRALEEELQTARSVQDGELERLQKALSLRIDENELLQDLLNTREKELQDQQLTAKHAVFKAECLEGDIEELKLRIRQKDREIAVLSIDKSSAVRDSNFTYSDSEYETQSELGSVEESPCSPSKNNHSVEMKNQLSLTKQACEVESLKNLLAEARQHSETTQERATQLKKELEDANAKIASMKANELKLVEEIKIIKSRKQHQFNTHDLLRKHDESTQRYEAELQSRHAQVSKLEHELHEAKMYGSDVRKKYEQTQENILALTDRLASLQAEHNECSATIGLLRQQLDRAQRSTEAALTSQKAEILKKNKEVAETQKRSAQLAADVGAWKAQSQGLQTAAQRWISEKAFEQAINSANGYLNLPVVVSSEAQRYLRKLGDLHRKVGTHLRFTDEMLSTLRKADHVSKQPKTPQESYSDHDMQQTMRELENSLIKYENGPIAHDLSSTDARAVGDAIDHLHNDLHQMLQQLRIASLAWHGLTKCLCRRNAYLQRTIEQVKSKLHSSYEEITNLQSDLRIAGEYGAMVRRENLALTEQLSMNRDLMASLQIAEDRAVNLTQRLRDDQKENDGLRAQLREVSEAFHRIRSSTSDSGQHLLPNEPDVRDNLATSMQTLGAEAILRATIREQRQQIEILRAESEELRLSLRRAQDEIAAHQHQVQGPESYVESCAAVNTQLRASTDRNEDVLSDAADVAALSEADDVARLLLKSLLQIMRRRASGETFAQPWDHDADSVAILPKLRDIINVLQAQCETLAKDYMKLYTEINQQSLMTKYTDKAKEQTPMNAVLSLNENHERFLEHRNKLRESNVIKPHNQLATDKWRVSTNATCKHQVIY